MVAAVRPQTALSSQTHIPRRQQICSCNTPSRPNSTPASSLKSTTSTSTQRLPCVILPGFLANTLAPTSQYAELRDSLLSLGHCGVTIIQASTWDWLPTLSGGSFLWYLQRLAAAVQELHAKHDSQVCLVGVSAGGWLARLALGSVPYNGQVFALSPLVHTLVTLGTPHQSLEAYPFGRAEEAWLIKEEYPADVVTSLQFANHHYPDAASLQPTAVACVAGSAVRGRAVGTSELREVLAGKQRFKQFSDAWLVQSAYVANVGDPAVDGDGVTPISAALLPGAQHLVLPDVYHNQNQSPGCAWYGTREVVEQWDKFLP